MAKAPTSLALAARTPGVSLLEGIGYPRAPRPSDAAVQARLRLMHARATDIGLALDTPISRKGLWIGYSEVLLVHPDHSIEVQAYVGLVAWFVVQYDDVVGQESQMREAAGKFHDRFFRGEAQPNALLNGIAIMTREAPAHFDSVLATLLQNSMLAFLTSNLLEQKKGSRA